MADSALLLGHWVGGGGYEWISLGIILLGGIVIRILL